MSLDSFRQDFFNDTSDDVIKTSVCFYNRFFFFLSTFFFIVICTFHNSFEISPFLIMINLNACFLIMTCTNCFILLNFFRSLFFSYSCFFSFLFSFLSFSSSSLLLLTTECAHSWVQKYQRQMIEASTDHSNLDHQHFPSSPRLQPRCCSQHH